MSRRTIGARIHLLSTYEGGRAGPLRSGYRSLLRFEGTEADVGFELDLDSDRWLAPGDSGNARVSFWAVDALPILSPGQKFEIREGTRVVGYGRIVQT